MKVVIITNGAFPVPASRGGAVEGLIEELIIQNDKFHQLDIDLVSIYDEAAYNKSKEYQSTCFKFIKPSKVSLFVDSFLHFIAYKLLKLSNHLSFKTIFQRIEYFYRVSKILKDNDYDKVVFENQMASLWCLKMHNNLQKYQNKFYFHLHNHPEKYANMENVVKKAKGIIGVSKFINNAFKNKIKDENDEHYYVLKNCVSDVFNVDLYNGEQLEELRLKYNLGESRIVLFAGRLIPGKGVKELMQAFNSLRLDNTKLLIVGSFNYGHNESNNYEKELIDLANDNVIFTGFIKRELLPLYYLLADIVCLPSTCEEAAGLTIVEAILMHKAVITTNMGGISEYAKDMAILLDNNQNLVDNIAKNINLLVNDSNLKEELVNKTYGINDSYSVKSYYDNFVEILRK